ncbi:MAG: MetS family NSS transporter small subunit [Ignavibacteria bacterium]|jgi:hypothetical protein
MEITTIITMIFVIGIVWGGLAFFLTRAIRYEKMKSEDGEN